MRRPALPWLTLAAALTGCQQMVELGSECPTGTQCGDRDDPTLDGGQAPDAEPPPSDAGAFVPPDDSGSAPSFSNAEFPLIQNGSFDVPAGTQGDLAVIPVSLEASPGVGSWQACQLVSVRIDQPTPFPTNFTALTIRESLTTDDGRVITPVDGDTFLTVSFPPFFPAAIAAVPMSQTLETPLKAGVRYAFAASLQGVDTSRTYSLRVYASDTSCMVEEPPLAEVEVPSDPGWHDVCVTFTAAHDSTNFLVTAGILEGVPISIDEKIGFLLDDIRTPLGCDAQ